MNKANAFRAAGASVTCELEQWAMQVLHKRQRIGETVAALVRGLGAGDQAQRMASAGARVVLLGAAPASEHANITCLPEDAADAAQQALPLEPFDLIIDQRSLSFLPYSEARAALRGLFARLKIGGKVFLSLYGIHSDLGDGYAHGGNLVGERFAPLAPEIAQRYGISAPLCLYSERNLFFLLMEAGGAVLKTSTSALGHVRGVAARI